MVTDHSGSSGIGQGEVFFDRELPSSLVFADYHLVGGMYELTDFEPRSAGGFDYRVDGTGPALINVGNSIAIELSGSGFLGVTDVDGIAGIFSVAWYFGPNGEVIGDRDQPRDWDAHPAISFDNLRVPRVPEPGTSLLLGAGVGALTLARRRRRRVCEACSGTGPALINVGFGDSRHSNLRTSIAVTSVRMSGRMTRAIPTAHPRTSRSRGC